MADRTIKEAVAEATKHGGEQQVPAAVIDAARRAEDRRGQAELEAWPATVRQLAGDGPPKTAAKTFSITAARAHIGRDLVQIREQIAETQRQEKYSTDKAWSYIGGELAGLHYAEQLLATTLARLQPEEGDGG